MKNKFWMLKHTNFYANVVGILYKFLDTSLGTFCLTKVVFLKQFLSTVWRVTARWELVEILLLNPHYQGRCHEIFDTNFFLAKQTFLEFLFTFLHICYSDLFFSITIWYTFLLLLFIQGWALRSFPFGTLRSFRF